MGHAIIKIMSFFVDVWNTIENRGVNSDMETQHIIHNFEPIYNEHSKILMLGTMPSAEIQRSRILLWTPKKQILESCIRCLWRSVSGDERGQDRICIKKWYCSLGCAGGV